MTKEVEKNRILLVSDEAFATEGYKLLLQNAGFAVETAMNGTRAIDKIKHENFDMVITDLLLPEKDILNLKGELLKKNMLNKVIAISESSRILEDNYPEMVRHFGVAEVLEKPFSLELLIKMVFKTIEK